MFKFAHSNPNIRVPHPFILSDNRHYIFYLWKDVLGPHICRGDNSHCSFGCTWNGNSCVDNNIYFMRFALVPLYAVSGVLLFSLLSISSPYLLHFSSEKRWSHLRCLLFFVSITAVLVPSPLIEFRWLSIIFSLNSVNRYFLIPLLITLLNLPPLPIHLHIIEIAGAILVNIVTMFIFLQKSFPWVDGSTARFMWWNNIFISTIWTISQKQRR